MTQKGGQQHVQTTLRRMRWPLKPASTIMAPPLPLPLSTDDTDRSSRPTRSMMNSSHAIPLLLPVESRSDEGLARLWAVSYSTQIVPFSPIRYDTSSGSIQIVSSSGSSFRSTTVFSPTAWPAFSMIGSILPLIRRQRKPEPLVGTSGYQWHWKWRVSICSSEPLKCCSWLSDSWFAFRTRSRFIRKSAAEFTSILMFARWWLVGGGGGGGGMSLLGCC
uniref:Uncharacterized protein n=1 Tax=Anopheles merus TaxID=30066 RepID=A0A182UVF6_ANOME